MIAGTVMIAERVNASAMPLVQLVHVSVYPPLTTNMFIISIGIILMIRASLFTSLNS